MNPKSLSAFELFLWLAAGLWMAAVLTPHAAAQPVQIADVVEQRIESPRPLRTAPVSGQPAWRHTLHWPGASFIAVHFERFELAPGDRLVLSDPEKRYRHTYTGRGLNNRGGDFWGLSIQGPTMEIAVYRENTQAADSSVTIDRWSHGYPHDTLSPEAVCGSEDFRDVKCYEDSHPVEYQRARAAVRLIKNGSAHCTGWLASCENHIITNQHCVAGQSELDQIEFQFEYQRPGCDTGSAGVSLQLQGGTLLEANQPRDFALIMPALAGHDPQAVYGYMKWDIRLPGIDERMYIPGHPSGDPKRLSLFSTDSHDQSGRCEVYSVSEPACQSGGPPDVGYYCDTEGGSSGSPVLSAVTHNVIALHHCANCPNRGVPIKDVYNFIQASSHPLPACVTCTPPPAPEDLVASTPADNQIKLDWAAVSGAVKYSVYRSTVSCDAGLEKIGEAASPEYLDQTVSVGIVYFYRVAAASACEAESTRSNCAQATPSGLCTEPPRFDGLATAASAREGSCGIDLAWAAAIPRCGQARYNIYRSTLPEVVPTSGNLVARCLTTLAWRDTDVLRGTTYRYLVRAEDDTGNGQGPCNGGNADSNLTVRGAEPSGPDLVLKNFTFEPPNIKWTLGPEWQIAPPQGKGGGADGGLGNPDPVRAFEGLYVLGHDLSGIGEAKGNYENNLSAPSIAQSPAFSTTGHQTVRLRFARWLGVDRAPGDRAVLAVSDGTTWYEVWANPENPLFDSAWTSMDFDVSAFIANRPEARIRFSHTSNGSGHAGGWNVDDLEVYRPTSCSSAAPSLPPVPDGRFAPGTPMNAGRGPGDLVLLEWDVLHCPSAAYNLFYGDSAAFPSLAYSGAVCGLGSSGTASAAVPAPAPGHATWWVIAGASGTTEGPHGYDSQGALREAQARPRCGLTAQTRAAPCD